MSRLLINQHLKPDERERYVAEKIKFHVLLLPTRNLREQYADFREA